MIANKSRCAPILDFQYLSNLPRCLLSRSMTGCAMNYYLRMSAAIDSYKVSARYYDDAYTAKQDLHDLPFYLDLARESGGPVLELACGTGRILLPIARQ